MTTLEVGSTVDRYTIEALIGSGGMGAVYKVRNRMPDRVEALKVMRPELAANEEFRSKFLREVQVASQLEHPNIIPIYDTGVLTAGPLYVTMRFVSGPTLGELIAERGRLEPVAAAKLIAQTADALDEAHRHGLVHRDVKPANILIARFPDSHVYLTDFGLAQLITSQSASWSESGTFDFMAPEQFSKVPLDARADVYALGCTLYLALTGESPWLKADRLAGEIPRPSAVVSEIPVALDQVVERALAPSRGDRYASAGALGRAALAAAAVGQEHASPAWVADAPGGDTGSGVRRRSLDTALRADTGRTLPAPPLGSSESEETHKDGLASYPLSQVLPLAWGIPTALTIHFNRGSWIPVTIAVAGAIINFLAYLYERAKAKKGDARRGVVRRALEERRQEQQRRGRLNALEIVDGRARVRRFADVVPYDLGVDREFLDNGQAQNYLPRDCDDRLREELEDAARSQTPRMVVVRGPSKAGKTRTLYEAVRAVPTLNEAAVIVPSSRRALGALLAGADLPAVTEGRCVLWLDDLERFVSAGQRGLNADGLKRLRDWPQPVVVVSTAGGRGGEQADAGNLSDPIEQLYREPDVRIVPLSNTLTSNEATTVRDWFPSEVAREVIAHGIGEYLVAAPELARKLEEERHKPGEPVCPEGAAVAWAVIDWERAGMQSSISEALLRRLWRLYIRGSETDERFQRGLDWALRPVYRSVALVQITASYDAFDWIVGYADREIGQPIQPDAWDTILAEAGTDDAFRLGVAAHRRGDRVRSLLAFERATASTEPLIRSRAAFNLGCLRAEDENVEGAVAAYRQAADSGIPEQATRAAFNIGVLLETTDPAGARAAYRDAMTRGQDDTHAAQAAFNLGMLLVGDGDEAAAAQTFQWAVEIGPPEVAKQASDALARMRFRTDKVDEDKVTEVRMAGTALEDGARLEEHGDLAGAELAYERSLESDPPIRAAQAAFRLGLLRERLNDMAGARTAYGHAIDSGHETYAPVAAFALGVMLRNQGELAGAELAYRAAIRTGHPELGPQAQLALGFLLQVEGKLDGAREAFEQALASADVDISSRAREALEALG